MAERFVEPDGVEDESRLWTLEARDQTEEQLSQPPAIFADLFRRFDDSVAPPGQIDADLYDPTQEAVTQGLGYPMRRGIPPNVTQRFQKTRSREKELQEKGQDRRAILTAGRAEIG